MTLDDRVREAHNIAMTAIEEHGPVEAVFLLLSGGNDSMVLLDVMEDVADHIVHINTGIGVPETNQFVRDVVAARGHELIEMHPPVPYDELILNPKYLGGFPGPAGHYFVYQRLKERCIEALLREHRTKRGQRFILLTGVRNDESRRRMGYKNPVDRKGGQVWVNPLMHWTNEEMALYRQTRSLPVNDVTKHLHMSGECLCGAFAHPGELDEIAFFYPHVAERIRELEAKAQAAGLRAAKWGERPPKRGEIVPGPMCTSCVVNEEEA